MNLSNEKSQKIDEELYGIKDLLDKGLVTKRTMITYIKQEIESYEPEPY